MVSNPIPDARRAGPGIAWKGRRTAPRHAAMWVRVGGQWRRGRVIEWVRQIDRDGWDCVIMADEPVSGPPWQGRATTLTPGASAPVTPTSHGLDVRRWRGSQTGADHHPDHNSIRRRPIPADAQSWSAAWSALC
jgi:hypothetical protein